MYFWMEPENTYVTDLVEHTISGITTSAYYYSKETFRMDK